MPCGPKEAGGVYRPRHPRESPFYRLVERFFPQFEAVYEERYPPQGIDDPGHLPGDPDALLPRHLHHRLDRRERVAFQPV